MSNLTSIVSNIDSSISVVLPFAQFSPLIKETSDIFNKVTDLYKIARHNTNITKILIERIVTANSAVNMLRFQGALIESMDGKISDKNVLMNRVIERVGEMQQNMQILMDIKKGVDQSKIDNIFQETPLQFGDYREIEDGYRTERLRKYVYIKTGEEYAFKAIDNYQINNVKNHVTILKKIKDCQNIIHFYGLTSGGSKTYIVTEWAENKNLREYISERGSNIETRLRIRIAYDIAKGLNFLNSVNVRNSVFYFYMSNFNL
ncbi:hypothetical protein C1645_842496 [Glomus cerebriforme]|uniref:Protein kinase domain-containing protein n=1 Tax=Glomus cerebriforme TaxID=658196 RepID=A0A397S2Y6_9GLOM|nr:hypothetical protein C1645_842496 [Glomus cerebriforme]